MSLSSDILDFMILVVLIRVKAMLSGAPVVHQWESSWTITPTLACLGGVGGVKNASYNE